MNTKVDWSKAPDGATHYTPKLEEGDFYSAVFWRLVDGKPVEAWRIDGPNEPLCHYQTPTYFKSTLERMIPRPTPWSGAGLPTVGTVCEYSLTNGGVWHECTIKYVLANGKQFVADCAGNPDGEAVLHVNTCLFRTLRTPEQIAAEEREKAIAEMTHGYPNGQLQDWAAHVYDQLGYRKQVAP